MLLKCPISLKGQPKGNDMPGTLRGISALAPPPRPSHSANVSPNTKLSTRDVRSIDVRTRHREEVPQNSAVRTPHTRRQHPFPSRSLSAFLPNAFLRRSRSHLQLLPTEAQASPCCAPQRPSPTSLYSGGDVVSTYSTCHTDLLRAFS